jgi:YesN/AraC family two-component response regulator
MTTHTPRLLIIDDQPDSVDLLMRFLAERSLEISIAIDGEEGLKLARQDGLDLILLDLYMPGMDGFEVCRRLKADPRTAGIPVVFLTASADIDNKLKGFELGAVDYIIKPYSEREVLARVFVQIHHKWQVERLQTMVGKRAIQAAGDKAFPEDQLFARALAILDGRMSDPPGLIELAAELGTNERKLTDVFRRRVGLTVFDYFSELRLESARHLLEGSGMRIQAIASQVGYLNAGDFTRAFRRHFGVTPRDYRRARCGKAGED